MSRYKKTIENLVQEYQPKIEKIVGTKLGPTIVEIEPELSEIGSYMAVLIPEDGYSILAINPSLVCRLFTKLCGVYTKKDAVVHELAHIAHYKLCEPYYHLDSLPNSTRLKCLKEGFAEYVTLRFQHIPNDKKVEGVLNQRLKRRREEFQELVSGEKKLNREDQSAYSLGYGFIEKVVSTFGWEKFIKELPHMPIPSEQELLNPTAYLQKNYPEETKKWEQKH